MIAYVAIATMLGVIIWMQVDWWKESRPMTPEPPKVYDPRVEDLVAGTTEYSTYRTEPRDGP